LKGLEGEGTLFGMPFDLALGQVSLSFKEREGVRMEFFFAPSLSSPFTAQPSLTLH
jgi:hypothetical protein